MWGRARREKRVVEQFVSALNAREMDVVASLLTPDFTYIDTFHEGVSGRDRVLSALEVLLASDPDFGIEIDRIDRRSPHLLMSGRVRSRNHGMGRRALWQVLIRDDQIAQYQTWAEAGPPPLSRLLPPDQVEDMRAQAAPMPDFRPE